MKSNFMNVIIVRNPVKEVKAEIKHSIIPKMSLLGDIINSAVSKGAT